MNYEDKIKELNIKLPEAKAPVGNYVATKISGKLLFVSGQISIDENGQLIKGKVDEILSSANIAIAASGTASLQIALHKKPMIIIYKGSWLSYFIWKMVSLIPNVSLPNILLNENIVPEMLQHRATPTLLSKKVCEIIEDKKYLKKIDSKFYKLHKNLKKNTSSLIFKVIKPYLK